MVPAPRRLFIGLMLVQAAIQRHRRDDTLQISSGSGELLSRAVNATSTPVTLAQKAWVL